MAAGGTAGKGCVPPSPRHIDRSRPPARSPRHFDRGLREGGGDAVMGLGARRHRLGLWIWGVVALARLACLGGLAARRVPTPMKEKEGAATWLSISGWMYRRQARRCAFSTLTDRPDAEGIARLLQLGRFRAVHGKSVSSFRFTRAEAMALRTAWAQLHPSHPASKGGNSRARRCLEPAYSRTIGPKVRQTALGDTTRPGAAPARLPPGRRRSDRPGRRIAAPAWPATLPLRREPGLPRLFRETVSMLMIRVWRWMQRTG